MWYHLASVMWTELIVHAIVVPSCRASGHEKKMIGLGRGADATRSEYARLVRYGRGSESWLMCLVVGNSNGIFEYTAQPALGAEPCHSLIGRPRRQYNKAHAAKAVNSDGARQQAGFLSPAAPELPILMDDAVMNPCSPTGRWCDCF